MELKTSLIEIVDEMEVFQIQLINENGIRAHFLTLGATWQAYLVPQTDGSYKNIVLGHKNQVIIWQMVSVLGNLLVVWREGFQVAVLS